MEYTKKSERSKRSEGSGVKAISRGSSLFSFVRFLASRKVSSQEQASAVYENRCDVFILWKIVEVQKYYFKCRSTNHGVKNTCCGDGVSLTFLAVMRCSLTFFAVLRCSDPPPPHVPLLNLM